MSTRATSLVSRKNCREIIFDLIGFRVISLQDTLKLISCFPVTYTFSSQGAHGILDQHVEVLKDSDNFFGDHRNKVDHYGFYQFIDGYDIFILENEYGNIFGIMNIADEYSALLENA